MRWTYALACAGCAVAAKPVAAPIPAPVAMPGLMWMTQAEPWQLPHPPSSLEVDGDAAIVGSTNGWVMRVDLATGRLLKQVRIGTATLYALVRLRDGRWLFVGRDEPSFLSKRGTTVAYVLDGATLVAERVPLDVRVDTEFFGFPHASVLDGGVVISAPNLAPAIYDPKTWARRELTADERAAVSVHRAAVFDRDRPGDNRVRLADGTELPEHWVTGFSVDASATRIAVWGGDDKLSVHELPGAALISETDLPGPGYVRFAGDRVVAAALGALRVVRSGVASPLGSGPRAVRQLAVDVTGRVLALGVDRAWQLGDGKVVIDEPLPRWRLDVVRPDDPWHRTELGPARGTSHHIGDADSKSQWQWSEPLLLFLGVGHGWLGQGTNLVVAGLVYEPEHQQAIYLLGGDGPLHRFARFERFATPLAADPATDALVATKGNVAVVRVRDGGIAPFQLRVPACDDAAHGAVEEHGDRAATFAGDELAVWNRTTGALVGAARLDANLADVAFVPGHAELLVVEDDAVVLWTPAAVKRLDAPGVAVAAVSADARRLALGFHDGRVAVFDYAALAAGLRASAPVAASIPATCP